MQKPVIFLPHDRKKHLTAGRTNRFFIILSAMTEAGITRQNWSYRSRSPAEAETASSEPDGTSSDTEAAAKTDDSSSKSGAEGTFFTGGNLAVAGGGGLLLGAVLAAVCMTVVYKKKKGK